MSLKEDGSMARMDDFLYRVDSSNCWDNDLPIRFWHISGRMVFFAMP